MKCSACGKKIGKNETRYYYYKGKRKVYQCEQCGDKECKE